MNIIVAVGKDYGIGKDNDLIYSIPEDKKFFRSKTVGKTIVMGRKTLESMPDGKPLPKRKSIVLSRNAAYSPEGAEVCHSLDELKDILAAVPDDDIFIIGGAEIYAAMLPMCRTAYVTYIDDCRPADKFFPAIDKMTEWELSDASEEKEYDGIKFRFCTYTNIEARV